MVDMIDMIDDGNACRADRHPRWATHREEILDSLITV